MQIDIRTPCSESWDSMEQRRIGRYCGRCEREVVDLSVLTRAQAEAKVRAAGGAMCVRIAVDARRHEPVFRREPERPRVRLAVLALAGALAACDPAPGPSPRAELTEEPDAAPPPGLDYGEPMLPIGLAPPIEVAVSAAVAPVALVEEVDDPEPTADQRARTRRKRQQIAAASAPTQPHYYMMGGLGL